MTRPLPPPMAFPTAAVVKITIWYTKAFGIGGPPPNKPKRIRTHWSEDSVDFSPAYLEYEVTRKEKLPSGAPDYCNVCLLCCLLMHVVMYRCSYFYYKYMTTNCLQVSCAFSHLKISSVSDAISNREIVTTVGGSSGISNLKILRNIAPKQVRVGLGPKALPRLQVTVTRLMGSRRECLWGIN